MPPTDHPLIVGVIALNPLARGEKLRRLLFNAWAKAPFGPSFNAYEREVNQAVADRECVDVNGKLTFGVERQRYRK